MKPFSPSVSTDQYEALRQNAVARAQVFSTEPLGAILVIKTGVAGWMRACRQLSGAVPTTWPPRSRPSEGRDWQHELTQLLAQMTVRHLSVSDSQL
jgi:hypothetical protein